MENFEDIDDEWNNFLQTDIYDNLNNNPSLNRNEYQNNNKILEKNEPAFVSNNKENDVAKIPKCSELYISTKTKITYLNITNIDIFDIFWKIPVIDYSTPCDGIIKKQIKFSSTSMKEVNDICDNLKSVKYYDNQIIEHIDNPDGRIKFKDQRKISIGVCKKDITTYRGKKKRAFFNCFVIIFRVNHDRIFREMHVKVFNTGKLEIPGIQDDVLFKKVLDLLISTLTPLVGEPVNYNTSKNETVLINSNFTCKYFIDRDKLYELLKYKYRLNSNYDACSYPGIQSKFYYNINSDIQTGQQTEEKENICEVSFMIFRTGSVLIVGKCSETILYQIYEFIKNILETEYYEIRVNDTVLDDNDILKQPTIKKVKKKYIVVE